MKRLGVNGVRIFGLAGNLSTTTGLKGFITGPPAPGVWGNDMNNQPVSSAATFSAAVALLRTPAGHLASAAASYANPPRWSAFNSMMQYSTLTKAEGQSMQAQVQQLIANGLEPLLVFWMACPVYNFTTLDSNAAAYWGERWELARPSKPFIPAQLPAGARPAQPLRLHAQIRARGAPPCCPTVQAPVHGRALGVD